MQTVVHYFFHLVFPLFIAIAFFKKEWKKAYLIMLATMLVDLDHLLATPIFQPDRCSIQFHPLHTYYAIGAYVVLLFLKKPWNMVGIGLILHMMTDLLDCVFMFHHCGPCMADSPTFGLLEWINNLY